jgi:hypothetical protein
MYTLARRDRDGMRRRLAAASVSARLRVLDQHLFGSTSSEEPDIRALAKAITSELGRF